MQDCRNSFRRFRKRFCDFFRKNFRLCLFCGNFFGVLLACEWEPRFGDKKKPPDSIGRLFYGKRVL